MSKLQQQNFLSIEFTLLWSWNSLTATYQKETAAKSWLNYFGARA
jgi:hypothetical protein